jgi:hypothetical protein
MAGIQLIATAGKGPGGDGVLGGLRGCKELLPRSFPQQL